MNRIPSFLAGAFVGAVALGMAAAAPITGAIDFPGLVAQVNARLLNWISFPVAELGEPQFLGPQAFETSTAGAKYLVTVDQAGNVLYILTTATAPN